MQSNIEQILFGPDFKVSWSIGTWQTTDVSCYPDVSYQFNYFSRVGYLLSVKVLAFTCEACIVVKKDRPTLKPTSCQRAKACHSKAGKRRGKSIRGILKTLGISSSTIWNVLKKKETTGVLSYEHLNVQTTYQQ